MLYSMTKENNIKTIDASGFEQNWKLDPKGYFLIRINKKTKEIEIGHCTDKPKPKTLIKGKLPEEIMYKTIELGLINSLNHAAYLGKELQKAC